MLSIRDFLKKQQKKKQKKTLTDGSVCMYFVEKCLTIHFYFSYSSHPGQHS